MKYFLKSLLPKYWIRNYETDEVWDKMLLGFLENPVFSERIDEDEAGYIINLNGVAIWIENYPYGFGMYANPLRLDVGMPSRRTVIKLKEALDNYRMQEIKKELGK